MQINMYVVDVVVSHPSAANATRVKNRYAALASSNEEAVKKVERSLMEGLGDDLTIEKIESRGPHLQDVMMMGV